MSMGSSSNVRDCHQLYCEVSTKLCTLRDGCVPCGYKIGLFDVALDHDFSQHVPNQRPELCPRLRNPPSSSPSSSSAYPPGLRVLTVGDGDLSFSLAIARQTLAKRSHNDNNHNDTSRPRSHVVATSYETAETLTSVYPKFHQTRSELLQLGATVAFRVDATRLAETLHHSSSNDPPFFDRIVWNFPCTAIPSGQDGQNAEMEENRNLIRQFVLQSARLLDDNSGELHICHKTKPPYDQWNLVTLVEESLHTKTASGEPPRPFKYKGRLVLDRATLIPYTPRKALDSKSFPCHDACIYIFGPSTEESSHHCSTLPPREDDDTTADSSRVSSVVPVNSTLIREIRETLLLRAKQSKKTQKYGQGSKKNRKKRAWNPANSQQPQTKKRR